MPNAPRSQRQGLSLLERFKVPGGEINRKGLLLFGRRAHGRRGSVREIPPFLVETKFNVYRSRVGEGVDS